MQHMILVAGPTGVGKSGAALSIANKIPSEIVNADMGQLYVPLTIGTAKPAWQDEVVAHHLFDHVEKPHDISVWQYRKELLHVMEGIWSRGNVPIIVGGSSFYIQSILYPPLGKEVDPRVEERPESNEDLWKMLYSVDPDRANDISKGDRYRLLRALSIWDETGVKPSLRKPIYDPPASYDLIMVHRERADLYSRIDHRVIEMFKQGWLKEVQNLMGTEWEEFLLEKKFIGYDDIIYYLRHSNDQRNYDVLIETIQKKTRNYAKRQVTFLRGLKRKIAGSRLDPDRKVTGFVKEVNLTLADLDLYINHLSERLNRQLTK